MYPCGCAVSNATGDPHPPQVLMASDSVADCLAALGQHEEALAMYEATLQAREERPGGAGDVATLRSATGAGMCLQVRVAPVPGLIPVLLGLDYGRVGNKFETCTRCSLHMKNVKLVLT